MKVKISIKNNITKEVASYEYEGWDVEYDSRRNWTQGNYGCDCNRYLFFERAKGNDPDISDGECSQLVNKYLVNIQEFDGDCNMILKEFEI